MTDRKIAAMHKYFGVSELSATCRQCGHLMRVQAGNRHVYKCEMYGDSASEATDWRLGYTACGWFGKDVPPFYTPLIEVLKHQPRVRENTIEGQIGFADLFE